MIKSIAKKMAEISEKNLGKDSDGYRIILNEIEKQSRKGLRYFDLTDDQYFLYESILLSDGFSISELFKGSAFAYFVVSW